MPNSSTWPIDRTLLGCITPSEKIADTKILQRAESAVKHEGNGDSIIVGVDRIVPKESVKIGDQGKNQDHTYRSTLKIS